MSLTPENVAAETAADRPKKVIVDPQKKPGVKVVKKKRVELRTAEMVEADIAKAERTLARISEQMGTPEVAREMLRKSRDLRMNISRLRLDCSELLYDEWDRVAGMSIRNRQMFALAEEFISRFSRHLRV